MAKRSDRIAAKVAHIEAQIAELQRNERLVRRLGGETRTNLDDEIAFQQARIDMLVWAEAATEAAIRARRTAIEAEVGPDGVDAKYGNTRGLPDDVLLKVVEMELMDIAVGEHPRQLPHGARRAAEGLAMPYTEYDWTTGDILTAARMDNLEQQWQEATQETRTTHSGGTLALDMALSNVFHITLNANLSISFSNVPASGRVGQVTLVIQGDGTQRTLGFTGTTVKWGGGTAPVLTATSAKLDVITLFTMDGGTTFLAFVAGQNH